MRAFSNRYELKYLLDWPAYYKIRKEIEPLFKKDPEAGKTGRYEVISLYYDTPALDFFWEKIEGEEQRVKVRLRTYVHECKEEKRRNETDIFLEIKKRRNRNILKKRVLLNQEIAHLFLKQGSFEKKYINGLEKQEIETLKEVECLQSVLNLKPTLLISYTREAFVSKDNFPLRMTFDSNVRYRHRDLSLTAKSMDKHVLFPGHIIMEIKYTEYLPQWLVQIIQSNRCEARSFSKYGTGMEHFLGEQSVFCK